MNFLLEIASVKVRPCDWLGGRYAAYYLKWSQLQVYAKNIPMLRSCAYAFQCLDHVTS
jgi:hypothetical protein